MSDYQDLKLGVDDNTLQLGTRVENLEVSTLMVKQAARTIEIISHLLDPAIYNDREFIQAMRNFIINHQRCKVRIIVFGTQTIVSRGSRLLDYAGDLSSFVEIRKVGEQHKNYNGALFIADESGYIHRNNAERYEAIASFYDPRQSRHLLRQFNSMWNAANSDPNLRRMRI